MPGHVVLIRNKQAGVNTDSHRTHGHRAAYDETRHKGYPGTDIDVSLAKGKIVTGVIAINTIRKDLFSEFSSVETCALAIKMAAAKKTHKKKHVLEIKNNPEKYAKQLSDMLRNWKYVPCPVMERTICDGWKKKPRIITKIKFFPDQVVHWCFILTLRKYFMDYSYPLSCGSIPGRGDSLVRRKIKEWLSKDRKGTKYYAKMDIRKCFPSVRKSDVIKAFDKRFKDKKIRKILKMLLEHKNPGEDKGLPIGFLTSPWLLNIMLIDFDNYLKHVLHIKYYVRYMDDFVIYGSNRRQLEKNVALLKDFLKKHYDMDIKIPNIQQSSKNPLDIVGYVFNAPNGRHPYVTIRPALFKNLMGIVRRVKHSGGFISLRNARAFISYNGRLKNTSSRNVYSKEIKPVISISKCKKIVSQADTISKLKNMLKTISGRVSIIFTYNLVSLWRFLVMLVVKSRFVFQSLLCNLAHRGYINIFGKITDNELLSEEILERWCQAA